LENERFVVNVRSTVKQKSIVRMNNKNVILSNLQVQYPLQTIRHLYHSVGSTRKCEACVRVLRSSSDHPYVKYT
jgi:hypothetical protein